MGRLILLVALVVVLVGCGATPTPTPTFARYKAADARQAFMAAGLSVTDWQARTESDADQEPRTFVEDYGFHVAALGNSGGRVLAFATPASLEASRTYWANWPVSRATMLVRGNLLLTLDPTLGTAEIARYHAALNTLP